MASVKNYQWFGINSAGDRVNGTARASSEDELEIRLARSGIDVLSIRVHRQLNITLGGSRVTLRDIVALTIQLEQLLRAGLSLMDVLDDLAASTENRAMREILSDIYDQMEGGKSFSDALMSYPQYFDRVFVYLVKVGEESGNLEHTLGQLAEMKKWQDELQAKAKKIMIYPSILLLVITMVFTFMMIFVVPDIVKFVTDMGGEIGPSTQALIATSDFMVDYWYTVLVTPIVLTVVIKLLLRRSDPFRLLWDRMLLKLPLFGEIIRKIKLARMANTIGIMYSSGISLPEIIRMVRNVMGNAVLERAMDRVGVAINDGRSVHESFDITGEFPPLVTRMIKVGERTGRMDEAMGNISYFYDREAKELIERIEPAVEPLLTITMAIIIGWVMSAVLGPVYDIITQI
ncbi:MAG: type II secretion system F family protein [Marinobacterium sp.]|nr:type II secretion system F family protein [Marinobacterium sp.]